MDITPPTEVINLKSFTLKCNASIVKPCLAPGLIHYAKLEWVDPNGEVITSKNHITITEEKDVVFDGEEFQNNIISTLKFKSVMFHHEGEYTCRSKIDFPDGKTEIYTNKTTRIEVIGKNMIK